MVDDGPTVTEVVTDARTPPAGAGLGLATVRGIAEARAEVRNVAGAAASR